MVSPSRHNSSPGGIVSHYGATMIMVVSPSMTYCTDRPALMMAVIRENTMVTRSSSYRSATTVTVRIRPVSAITASRAA